MIFLYLCIGIGVAGLLLFLLKNWGIWGMMVSVSIVASSLRAPLFSEVPSGAWYLLQFGALGIAVIDLLFAPARNLRRVERNLVAWLIVFVFFVLMSALLSTNPGESFLQAILLTGIVGFLICSYTRRWADRRQIRNDLSIIYLTIVFLQFVGLLGYVFSSWAVDPDFGRFTGVYSNANYAGMMAAISIVLGLGLANDKPTFKNLTFLTLLYIALLLSGSRGSILAAIVGVALILIISKGKISLALLPILLPFAILTVISNKALIGESIEGIFRRSNSGDLTSGRLDLFDSTFDLFLSAPVLGVGYRMSEPIMDGIIGHNIYLVLLADVGLLGFGAFCGCIAFILKAGKNSGENRFLFPVVLTVGIIELTESSIFGFGGPNALTVWLIALMLAASGAGEAKQPLTNRDKSHRNGSKDSIRRSSRERVS